MVAMMQIVYSLCVMFDIAWNAIRFWCKICMCIMHAHHVILRLVSLSLKATYQIHTLCFSWFWTMANVTILRLIFSLDRYWYNKTRGYKPGWGHVVGFGFTHVILYIAPTVVLCYLHNEYTATWYIDSVIKSTSAHTCEKCSVLRFVLIE